MVQPVSKNVSSIVTLPSLPAPASSTQPIQSNPIVEVAKTAIQSQQEDVSKKRSLAESSVSLQEPPAKAPKIEGKSEGPSKVAPADESLTIEQKIEGQKTDLLKKIDVWAGEMKETLGKEQWGTRTIKRIYLTEQVERSKAKISCTKTLVAYKHALDTSEKKLEERKSQVGQKCSIDKLEEGKGLFKKAKEAANELSVPQASEK